MTTNGSKAVEIHLVYQTFQPKLYGQMAAAVNQNIHYYSDWPADFQFLNTNADKFKDQKLSRILILDDVGLNAKSPERIAQLYWLINVAAHHTNTFLILIVHDLLFEKAFRPCLKSTTTLMLTRSHLDFVALGKLFFAGKPGFLRNSCQLAFFQMDYRYICIGNDSLLKPGERLKTGLLPYELGMYFRSV